MGEDMKSSFRRNVSPRLMQMWLDLVSIAQSISNSDDCDAIILSLTVAIDFLFRPFLKLSV
jgi:hypothetical protein